LKLFGRLVFFALLVLIVVLAAMLAYTNPQPIDIDIGILRVERVSLVVAFTVVFGLGWVFGIFSVGLALWRSASEKRRLRRDLRYAEAEISALRQGPSADAH